MTTANETLKNKVIARLIKLGCNAEETHKTVDLHFEEASGLYTTVKAICDYISVNY